MELLLDEMIGPRVAERLHAHGLDVEAVVQRPGLRALPDEAILEQARLEQRVLVTRNISEFARLVRKSPSGELHGGLVMVAESAFPQNRDLVGALVTALVDAADAGRLPAPGQGVFLRPT